MKHFALILMAALTQIATAAPPPTIAFYVVSETKSAGMRYIDTPDLPKVGYVAATPTLTIAALKSVKKTFHPSGSGFALPGRKSSTVWGDNPSVSVTLFDADRSGLELATARAVGKRMLIEVNGVPVIAPHILVPLSDPVFIIQLNDPKTREALYKALQAAIKAP